MLSLLGAAGERIGYDRWLKGEHREAADAFVFRQGLIFIHQHSMGDMLVPPTAR